MQTLIEVCFGTILVVLTVEILWVLLAIAKEFWKYGIFGALKKFEKETEKLK